MLVVVCRDGNNKMFPIAWAVVEVENEHTLTWLLQLVKNYLDLGKGNQLFIITNMQTVITDIQLTILLLCFDFLIFFCYVGLSENRYCSFYCIATS